MYTWDTFILYVYIIMNYDVLSEEGNYWKWDAWRNGYKKELFESLEKEEVMDMDVDFDAVVSQLQQLTTKSEYAEKHHILSNIGYLLSHNTPSLAGYDATLSTNKDLADKLVLIWTIWESDEYVVDEYLEKVQTLLK